MKLIFNNLETPYVINRCCDPLTAFLAFTSAAAALGSTASSNQANRRINRENNEFNAQEAQKQRDWQESMWNKMNAYNSPSAQMARLRGAGLNPYLSASGNMSPMNTAGSAGEGSSASASAPLAMQAADMSQAFNPMAGVELSSQRLQNRQVMANLIIEFGKEHSAAETQKFARSLGFDWTDENSQSYLSRRIEMSMNDSQMLKNDSEVLLMRSLGYQTGRATIDNLNAQSESFSAQAKELLERAATQGKTREFIDKEMYELGARAAQEFAQSNLFKEQKNGVYLDNKQKSTALIYYDATLRLNLMNLANTVKRNNLGWATDYMNYRDRRADYLQQSEFRDWKSNSPWAKKAYTQYKVAEGTDLDPIFGFLRGFSNSLPSIGIRYKSPVNMNRTTSFKSFVDSYGTYNNNMR